jgi:hypothetical protein
MMPTLDHWRTHGLPSVAMLKIGNLLSFPKQLSEPKLNFYRNDQAFQELWGIKTG